MDFVTDRIHDAFGPQAAVDKAKSWASAGGANAWYLHLVMGQWQQAAGDQSGAEAQFQQAVSLATKEREKVQACISIALFYQANKQLPQAEKAYLDALKVSPRNPDAMNNLAYLYANDMNQPDKAMPYIKSAVQMLPDNASVLDTYGWVLAKSGSYDQAISALRGAMTLGGDDPAPRYHLGWTFEKMGRTVEAGRQYQDGLALLQDKRTDPLYEVLKQAKDRIDQQNKGGETP
jgi:Tfp pilus assembly protein PilF